MKTRKLEGVINGHHFAFQLGVPKGERYDVEADGAWRETPEHPGSFAAWHDGAALEDFLKKKAQNQAWIAEQTDLHRRRNPKEEKEWPASYNEHIHQIERRVPNPPQLLAGSAEAGIEFDMERIKSLVETAQKRLLEELGVLPPRPTLIPWWTGTKGIQPLLRIDWKGE